MGHAGNRVPRPPRIPAAGRLGPGKPVTRKVVLEETSAVIAAMDDYDTLGFTAIDRF